MTRWKRLSMSGASNGGRRPLLCWLGRHDYSGEQAGIQWCVRCESVARINPRVRQLAWKLACKHGHPNFVHCPECD